jgi:hypothetical protein
MPKVESLPADTPIDAVMAVLDRDGAVILTGMISPAEADAMTAELTPFLDATKVGRDPFSGFKTTRTGALPARSEKVRKALLEPKVRAVADRVLLPNCERYQVNVTHIIRIMPGEIAQVMHKDRWSWQYLKGMEPQLNTIWALTDFTKENGATHVVPGSQHWPDSRRPVPSDTAYAEMHRHEPHLLPGMAAPGGEPVSLLPAGDRGDVRAGAQGADGIRHRRLRPRLLHTAEDRRRTGGLRDRTRGAVTPLVLRGSLRSHLSMTRAEQRQTPTASS